MTHNQLCGILATVGIIFSQALAEPSSEIETRRGSDLIDVESTRLLRRYTTDVSFLTRWVDHVPASDTVPSPRDFLGYVVGTPTELTKPETINAYFRKLAETSDRVRVFSMGESRGGREMIIAAIADAGILERLEEIKAANHRLSDPRVTSEEEASRIARSIPPTYWITAGLHSPETGPPEMVMEPGFNRKTIHASGSFCYGVHYRGHKKTLKPLG